MGELHYVQDWAFTWAALKHAVEPNEPPERILDLCRTTVITDKNVISTTRGALCVALNKSVELLERFIDEYRRPIDINSLDKKVKRVRRMKILTFITALTLIAMTLSLIIEPARALLLAMVLAFFLGIFIATHRPKVHYEAMRAGLMIIKPEKYRPAY